VAEVADYTEDPPEAWGLLALPEAGGLSRDPECGQPSTDGRSARPIVLREFGEGAFLAILLGDVVRDVGRKVTEPEPLALGDCAIALHAKSASDCADRTMLVAV
jgi:hypothetical protein